MLRKALGSSRHRGDAAEIAQLRGEATPSLTGGGRTEYERRLAVAVDASIGSVASAARAFPRRGVWRRGRRATRRCDTDFRSVGHIDEELEASAGGSALSAEGEAELDQQRTPGDTRRSRARTDAEVSVPMIFPEATPTPNHAMQLTATRLAINVHGSYSAPSSGESALSVAAADLESR